MIARCHRTYQDSDSLGVHKTTQFNATQHTTTQGKDKDKDKTKTRQRTKNYKGTTKQDKTRQDKRMDKTMDQTKEIITIYLIWS